MASKTELFREIAVNMNGTWKAGTLHVDSGTVYLDVLVDDTIELMSIRCEPEGAGLGGRIIRLVQDYATRNEIPVRANEITEPGFFRRMGFTEDEDYDEELFGHDEPDQWWHPPPPNHVTSLLLSAAG